MSLPSSAADSSKDVRARVREALHCGDIKTGAPLVAPPPLQRCHAGDVQLYPR